MNNEKTKKQLSEDDLIRPCTEDIWSFPYIEEDNAENREAVQKILKRQKHDEVQTELERLAGGYEFVFGLDNWFVNAVAKSDLPNDQEIIILKDVKFKGNEVYFESKEDLKKAIKEIGEERILKDYFGIELNNA